MRADEASVVVHEAGQAGHDHEHCALVGLHLRDGPGMDPAIVCLPGNPPDIL